MFQGNVAKCTWQVNNCPSPLTHFFSGIRVGKRSQSGADERVPVEFDNAVFHNESQTQAE